MSNAYDFGDTVHLTASFADQNSNAQDPTQVVLTLIDPAGVRTTPVPVHDATGQYHYDLFLTPDNTKAGKWRYRWEGTGTISGAGSSEFYVRYDDFT